jgi:transposase
MRAGLREELVSMVQEQLKADLFCGTIYCFRSKRADRVKLVFWDGTGLCLLCKRLPEEQPNISLWIVRLCGGRNSHQ